MEKFIKKLYIKLQNIKLSKIQTIPFFIELMDINGKNMTCEKFDMINNFYIDSFGLKFVLKYMHKTTNIMNKVIVKFVNRLLFYYIKVTWKVNSNIFKM